MADPSITARYVNTKQQVADIFTKANFTAAQWNILCEGMQIGLTSISSTIGKKEKNEAKDYVPQPVISLQCSHSIVPPGGTSCGGVPRVMSADEQ